MRIEERHVAIKMPKALGFDVFGTVVDWRGSVARQSRPLLDALGRPDIDAGKFADGWRARYAPAMKRVNEGARPFVVLDVLHRENLEELLREYGIDPADAGEEMLGEWNRAWHKLDPWPDTVAGLIRLKRKFPIVSLSNGNIAMMVAMARHGSLPWDTILGAEFARFYKLHPRAYLASAEALGLDPSELCLVAAHHSDLAAARACGLMTAYVDRPDELGGAPAPDRHAAQDWEWSASSFTELADILGCE
jgi:2-haloacid dehalogenase